MADAERDVLKIYDDLILRFTGKDAAKAPEGFVISLRPMALPINSDDYIDPWHPASGGEPSTGTPEGDAAAVAKVNKSQRSLFNTSRLVDAKLMVDGSGRVFPASTSLSKTWKAITTAANAVPLPPIEDPNLKKSIEDATKLIFKPDPEDPNGMIETDTFQRYKTYRKKYYAAVVNYANAYLVSRLSPAAASAFAVTGHAAVAEVDSARDDWLGMGKKDKVEEALAVLGAQGTDAATAVIAAAKRSFDKWNLTLGIVPEPVQYVRLQPSNWCDPAAEHDGWREYGYKRTDTTTTASSRSKSWGVNGGVSMGFWSAKAEAGQTTTHVHNEFSYDGLEIQMKIAVADIDRPGFDTSLLNLNGWFLHGQKKLTISDGTNTQQRPESTETFFLPGIPTQLILIKNLKIKTGNTKTVYDELKKTTNAGGSVGIGPFSIGGHYKSESSDTRQDFHEEGEWIAVDGVQVIGYVTELPPPCPQVDAPNLHQ